MAFVRSLRGLSPHGDGSVLIRERPLWLVYAVAVAAVATATALRWALQPVVGVGMPFLLLFPAITLAAWFGGFFPGLFATFLGGVLAEYHFADLNHQAVSVPTAHAVRLFFVTISGSLVSLLCEGFRRESTRAQALTQLANRRADEARIAQLATAQSEALYRAIGESINYGVWICDAQGQNLYTSASFLDLLGITQDHVSRLGWLDYLHPDDKQPVADAWQACVAKEDNWDMEMRFRSRQGVWHPVIARGIPIRDESGVVIKWAGITLDIRQLREVENAYRETADRFRVAVKSLPVTLFNLDRDLRYQWILHPPGGESAERIVGRRDDELGPPGSRDALIAFKRSILASGVGARDVIPMDLPQGRRWYDVTAEPTRDTAGEITGLTIAAIDVTARKLEEVELEHAKEAAEAASRAKDHFLAVLSHELRTPLTPVLTTAQMLAQDPSIPEHLREPIDLIRRNTELEARLIDDLLDLTRISRGTLQMHLEPVDAHLALNDVIRICQDDITAKQLTLNLNLQAAHATLLADAPRLRQIFWNLLKNAIKFTPQRGCIHLTTANPDAAS